MRSVESPFRFLSYKVDEFIFQLADDVDVLFADQINQEDWQFKVGFRQPQYFVDRKFYVGGFAIDMRVLYSVIDKSKKEEETAEEELINLHAAIGGIFQCEEGKLETEIENRLVKNHIPAILMPYLRSTISSFLANAGYGSIILPLININALAEEAMKDIDILKIEKKAKK